MKIYIIGAFIVLILIFLENKKKKKKEMHEKVWFIEEKKI